MIITICMVNGISDQKPLPPWMARSVGFSPAATPIRKTTTMPTSAKTRGSGNQRSLQLESATPMRARRFKLGRASCFTPRPCHDVEAVGDADKQVREGSQNACDVTFALQV